jgi:hypothetical protein
MFQLCDVENKLYFDDDDDVHFVHMTKMLNWIVHSVSTMKQLTAGRHVAPLRHLLSLFRATNSLMRLAYRRSSKVLPIYSL